MAYTNAAYTAPRTESGARTRAGNGHHGANTRGPTPRSSSTVVRHSEDEPRHALSIYLRFCFVCVWSKPWPLSTPPRRIHAREVAVGLDSLDGGPPAGADRSCVP